MVSISGVPVQCWVRRDLRERTQHRWMALLGWADRALEKRKKGPAMLSRPLTLRCLARLPAHVSTLYTPHSVLFHRLRENVFLQQPLTTLPLTLQESSLTSGVEMLCCETAKHPTQGLQVSSSPLYLRGSRSAPPHKLPR